MNPLQGAHSIEQILGAKIGAKIREWALFQGWALLCKTTLFTPMFIPYDAAPLPPPHTKDLGKHEVS